MKTGPAIRAGSQHLKKEKTPHAVLIDAMEANQLDHSTVPVLRCHKNGFEPPRRQIRKHPDRSYLLRPMIKGEAPVLGPSPDGTRYVTIVRNEPGTGQMRFLTTVPVNMDIKRASDHLLNAMWSFLLAGHSPDYVLSH